MRIGIAQTLNSRNSEENTEQIWDALKVFESANVDLIVFPECALSGFSAHIKAPEAKEVQPLLNSLMGWSKSHNTGIVLPTALKEDSKIYNTGFYINESQCETFYKQGLTPSEKKFFNAPDFPIKKTFTIQNKTFVILLCMEAQESPWTYFQADTVDFIIWPAYWGWTPVKRWGESDCRVYQNMKQWRRPLIQANFSENKVSDSRSSGPQGLSVAVSDTNVCINRGLFKSRTPYFIELETLITQNRKKTLTK